eukprot:CAMPEP_0201504374 /NCGR_PEP_ID=MMETSP0151_2-20130828/85173_1 /ASSEMBLY_ACC=CAM_ASM_000257 /TAXON_ID=200890 /ORGANISM="Paramoeba atlantica, Strain 621/1 / CCAP 1560/9" /LENGTH=131 /DNA_ID=CAMNT_0047898111 /DNA_START=217 /DNA_END=613 /DNA_ORIENTATION=+
MTQTTRRKNGQKGADEEGIEGGSDDKDGDGIGSTASMKDGDGGEDEDGGGGGDGDTKKNSMGCQAPSHNAHFLLLNSMKEEGIQLTKKNSMGCQAPSHNAHFLLLNSMKEEGIQSNCFLNQGKENKAKGLD